MEARAIRSTRYELTTTHFVSNLRGAVQVVALLDRDIEDSSDNDRVHLLPVSMIENFLLDPDSIWEAIQSVIEKTNLCSKGDVRSALDAILDGLEYNEVERRAIAKLGTNYFRPHSSTEQVQVQLDNFIASLRNQFSDQKVNEALELARVEVDAIRNQNRRREEFHGKFVLRRFYGTYLHNTGLSREVFFFETARYARNRNSVKNFFDDFFKRIANTSTQVVPVSQVVSVS